MLRATVGSETYFRRQQALPFAPNLWGLPPVRDASALGEVRVISRSQPLCPSLDAGIRAAAPVFHLALARGRSPRSFGLIGPSCGGSCAQRTTLPRRRRLRGQRVFNRPCVSRLLSAASAWLHACLSACLLPPPPGFFSFLLLSPHASVGACSTCLCVCVCVCRAAEPPRTGARDMCVACTAVPGRIVDSPLCVGEFEENRSGLPPSLARCRSREINLVSLRS